jgi:hypothetical protein
MWSLVVYPWMGVGIKAKYVAVITNTPEHIPSAIFSAKLEGPFSDHKTDEKARVKARELGINYVQGLDMATVN